MAQTVRLEIVDRTLIEKSTSNKATSKREKSDFLRDLDGSVKYRFSHRQIEKIKETRSRIADQSRKLGGDIEELRQLFAKDGSRPFHIGAFVGGVYKNAAISEHQARSLIQRLHRRMEELNKRYRGVPEAVKRVRGVGSQASIRKDSQGRLILRDFEEKRDPRKTAGAADRHRGRAEVRAEKHQEKLDREASRRAKQHVYDCLLDGRRDTVLIPVEITKAFRQLGVRSDVVAQDVLLQKHSVVEETSKKHGNPDLRNYRLLVAIVVEAMVAIEEEKEVAGLALAGPHRASRSAGSFARRRRMIAAQTR